ncbi:MAG: type II toxin-antitoxin system VapC family toxin [candidate division KSB1 bacterium]|nr:type II toxin-antitoxin system VapC family toxin [candidate division KSB1 bacterium]MDZ7304839.1 type II toxin-antitoxin system VapC family toxin [candidate division KSB1 bacterium]MDZ7313919.1 type II toxin-antitoxin system VapC family toxin [candidate division KSB1 bacterium]
MSTYYLDSSGIVKRYINETGSAWITATTDPASRNEVLTSLISGAEVVAAICRSGRIGSITRRTVTMALAAFKREFRMHFVILYVLDQVIDRAMTLAEKHGLRGYDSVQLATAVEMQTERDLKNLPPLIFVSSDNQLLTAARAEGLIVENPNNYP